MFEYCQRYCQNILLHHYQKALVVGDLIEKSSEWQEIQRKIKEDANKARSEAQAGNQNAIKEKTVYPHIEGALIYLKSPSATAKAELIGVSRPAVERANLISKHPEFKEKVASGEMA